MTEKVNHRREISGILYLTVAVLLAVSYYVPTARTGLLGKALLSTGQGLIGLSAYALPALFLYMAVERFMVSQPRMTTERFRYIFLMLICIAGFMHILTIDLTAFRSLAAEPGPDPSALKSLQILYLSGADPHRYAVLAQLKSGGLIGGILAHALTALAGVTGSAIILAAFILTLIVLLFNVSYARAIDRTAKAITQTGQRMNEAVRTSVTNLKNQAELDRARSREAYDLRVGQNPSKEPSSQAVATYQIPTAGQAHGAAVTGVIPPAVGTAAKPAGAGGFAPVGTQPAGEERDELAEPVKSSFWNSLFHPKARGLQDKIPSGAASDLTQDGSDKDLAIPSFLQEAAEPVAVGNTGGFVLTTNTDASGDVTLDYQIPSDMLDEDELSIDLPAGVHRIDETNPNRPVKPAPSHPLDPLHPDHDASGSGDAAHPHPKRVRVSQIPLPYQLPPLHLLNSDSAPGSRQNQQTIQALGRKLEDTLKSFGVDARVVNYTAGATITRFELTPGPGVKVSRIVSLADDIALNLAAMGVRIEAPIPGKSAIGIEIPNKETSAVLLRSILESPEYVRSNAPLTAALGRDIQGTPILCDIARMPHLLIAGATGSGKSVCINTILMSILFRCTPDQVRMLMIDPKVVELSMYNGIPHLLSPVVTDPRKAANTLLWAVNEMVRRYGLFAEKSVRDIHGYQIAAKENPDEYEPMPLILLVIDELADLMSTAPTEVEDAIARLTAMARAAGIHLVIATQRPSVDVITGVIKANIPSRIAFAVASQVDSRTILDMGGAEKLLGKGDMLYFPQSLAKPVRGQGGFVSDAEVEKVLAFIKSNHADGYDASITEAIMTASGGATKGGDSGDQDELLPNAVEIVVEAGYASVSLLQRRMNVGYPRAARLIDRMQEKGFVGPFEGSKPRKVLINIQQLMELKSRGDL